MAADCEVVTIPARMPPDKAVEILVNLLQDQLINSSECSFRMGQIRKSQRLIMESYTKSLDSTSK